MRRIINGIPNSITLINLLCGSIGIVFLWREEYNVVVILVFISLIADFLDGLLARYLKVISLIGKDLDSLADLVTFGLLPSMILYHLAEQQEHSVWNYICFSVVVFSAIRLAKFNHDVRQSYYFIGLPTPANTMFILSLLIFMINEKPEVSEHSLLLKWNAVFFSNVIYSTKILRLMSVVSAILLVLPVKLISLKVPKFAIKEMKQQWILLAGCIIILILFGQMALFWIMLWYLLWSITWYYFIV